MHVPYKALEFNFMEISSVFISFDNSNFVFMHVILVSFSTFRCSGFVAPFHCDSLKVELCYYDDF